MEWLVIVFYVVGFSFGIYLGKTVAYDKFYDDVYGRICRHVYDVADDVESRLKDDVFETQRERDVACGSFGAYLEMIDFLGSLLKK